MEDRGPELLAVVLLFLILSWLTVLTRCWVRIRMVKAFAIDDWLLVTTLGLFTIYASFCFIGVHWGCGRHMGDLTTHQKVKAMRAWYYGEILYIAAACFLRLAVGAFLLRVAVRKAHRNIVHACNAVNILFNIYYIIFTIVQCSPIDGFWLRFSHMNGVICQMHIAVVSTLVASAISAIIDWTFGILPIFILWDLNMNRKKKITLGFVMGLGAIASTAPIVRIPYTTSLANSHDFLWSTTDVAIWSVTEPGLGMIAVSLVALRPLFVSLFKGLSTTEGVRTTPRKHRYGATPRAPTTQQKSSTSKPNTREGYWEDASEEPSGLQLHGIPKARMGHTVTIQAGAPPPQPKNSKTSKSGNGSFNRSFNRSRRRSDEKERSGEGWGLGGITKTYDFRAYEDSGNLSEVSLQGSPAKPFTPLDSKGGGLGRKM